MNYLETVSVGLVLAIAQTVAMAQIYESKDEQGNPVFSDEPVNGDSSMVDLTETNIADAPAPQPAGSTPPGTRTNGEVAGKASSQPAYQDPNEALWQERERREKEFERAKASSTPHEVLDAEPRHEVMDAEPRREVMDAEPRREVMDAEPRREVMDAEPRREVGDFNRAPGLDD